MRGNISGLSTEAVMEIVYFVPDCAGVLRERALDLLLLATVSVALVGCGSFWTSLLFDRRLNGTSFTSTSIEQC
jgi:hypothetical protein